MIPTFHACTYKFIMISYRYLTLVIRLVAVLFFAAMSNASGICFQWKC